MRTHHFAWKTLLATALGLGLFCILAGAVYAAPAQPALALHAKVLTANPAIGSTVAQAPAQVTVFTAEGINPDPKKSNLQVYGPGPDATDTLISSGNAQVPLSNPKEMSISITPNAGHTNGVYIVFWQTVSADDGDAASGTFSFTVGTAAASSTPAAAPTASASQSQGSPASTASNSGIPAWVPIVSAIVALLIGLGAGLGLARSRRPAGSSLANLRASINQKSQEEP